MKSKWLIALVPVLLANPLLADEKLEAEIQPLFDRMEELYAADPNGSRQIFDELWLQDENIVYVSEQFDNPFYGYGPVASYWKPSWNTLYGYREQYSDLRATLIAPDIALANVNLRYDMHAVTRTPLGGWSRLTLVLHKVEGEWKIQQYYETPMSLLSQGRRIHEVALDPEFAEFARKQNPQYDELVKGDANINARKSGVPWTPRPPFRPAAWGPQAKKPADTAADKPAAQPAQ